MNLLLSFERPLEFLLRYTVITGILLAIIGTALCLLAKRITISKRGTTEIQKNDSLYLTLLVTGLCFILLGVIFIALPIPDTFYVG